MTKANANIYEQVYNVEEDDTLLSRVASVVCVLVRRGLFVAGFSAAKELLTIHYTGYNKNKAVWGLDFFEQLFANEPLLAAREKVKGVFINSHKNLIVPDELYAEQAANEWLKKLFFVEQKEIIATSRLVHDKAVYIHAVPLNVSELVRINYRKAVVLPFSSYQFEKREAQSLHIQCCITGEQVIATLHNYSQLLWHKVFDYTCAEDIAYNIKLLCKENHIDAAKLNIDCTSLAGTEYDIINELTQYFPVIKTGEGNNIQQRWDTAISLANQLLKCVS